MRGRYKGVILNVAAMGDAVEVLESILGTPPQVRDGEQWSTFTTDRGAFSLAGAAETMPVDCAISIEVEDVESAVSDAVNQGGQLIGDVHVRHQQTRGFVRLPGGIVAVFHARAE